MALGRFKSYEYLSVSILSLKYKLLLYKPRICQHSNAALHAKEQNAQLLPALESFKFAAEGLKHRILYRQQLWLSHMNSLLSLSHDKP